MNDGQGGGAGPSSSPALGDRLVEVNHHLRMELETVRTVLEQVRQGVEDASLAGDAINDLILRENDWRLGACCATYARVVSAHHGLEDDSVFPHLLHAEPGLSDVLDRLTDEHHVIHGVLQLLDERLVEFIAAPGDFSGVQDAINLLGDTLLPHLEYEEEQLVEPLSRWGFYPDQVMG
ncbi:MAG TPA: hemerythrin domain-containing protein [Propionibacteriaceae bacterium]|nr:hemerythrin domain-containing protein [Propionibacteriaceae bacterium]